jgi:hypothetical protein
MTCPHCQESAKFVNYRPKSFLSLLGDIRFERGYYHCAACKNGRFPGDEDLKLSPQRLTRGAQEVITLAGIQESFGKAADRALQKMTGLRVSESTVERTAEGTGERLAEQLAAGKTFGESKPWKWNKDAAGKTCGYVSLDATGIMMQGPKGAKAEGRMVYVGMIYNPKPRLRSDDTKPCEDVRYLAGLTTLDELGEQLRRQAAQVGMNAIDQWIAVSDAGSGLENFFDVHFPLAVKIVDFWHATEHLTPLSKRIPCAAGSDALLSAWCHQLKHEGGTALLATLEKLDRDTMSEEVRVDYDEVLTYYRNHAHKMNYPEYLKRGWQIGSGSVESACKNVINRRLSMGGMRWGDSGADAIANLRALFCSEKKQWDSFWCMAA